VARKASQGSKAADPFPKMCLAAGLPEPRKEFRFHPLRLWRVDYYFPELGLAVEKEGGAFCQGRHTRGAGFREDLHKYNALTLQGISLLRFLPEQMRSLEAIAVIKKFQENKARRVGSREAGSISAGLAPSQSTQEIPGPVALASPRRPGEGGAIQEEMQNGSH
jgi:hypothetical protein